MIIMSVIGAVAIIIIQSIRFGKRIKKQMQPVLDACLLYTSLQLFTAGAKKLPTMKSIGGVKDENGVSSKPSEEVKACLLYTSRCV